MSDNLRASTEIESARNLFLANERVSKTTCFSKLAALKSSGGARRDRTDDLLLAKQALSQLSYGPEPVRVGKFGLTGLPRRSSRAELPALALSGYGVAAFVRCAGEGWWAWEDLNFRPHAYQARALTN